jgi:hypothetical protein
MTFLLQGHTIEGIPYKLTKFEGMFVGGDPPLKVSFFPWNLFIKVQSRISLYILFVAQHIKNKIGPMSE